MPGVTEMPWIPRKPWHLLTWLIQFPAVMPGIFRKPWHLLTWLQTFYVLMPWFPRNPWHLPIFFNQKKRIRGNRGGANFNGPLPWFPGNPWHIGGPQHHPGQLTYENHPPPIALDPVFDPPLALVSAETLATGGVVIFNHELPWFLFIAPKNKQVNGSLPYLFLVEKTSKSIVHCFAFSGSKKK